MATTLVAPTSTQQINDNYYVGEGYLTTMQAAVNAAVASGRPAIVIIPHGYTGADTVASITGGSAIVYVIDDRGSNQRYTWSGTQYVPQDMVQATGFVSHGMPAYVPASIMLGFDPLGDLGNGSGNVIVNANPGDPMPSLNLILNPQDGTHLRTFLRCALDPTGHPRNQSTTLEIYSDPAITDIFNLWIGRTPDVAGNKGMYVWAKPDENAIDFQGETYSGTYDQTIRLNYLGGDVLLGPNVIVAESGQLSAQSIIAPSAEFADCMVDNSPVRTFANTGDPDTGMSFPPAGIGVSTGTAWDDNSIDPATVPRLNVVNTFTAPQAVVETGAHMNVRGNISPSQLDLTHGGSTWAWNVAQGTAETSFVNVGSLVGSGGFDWYNTWLNGGPNPPQLLMRITSQGVLNAIGAASFNGVTATGPPNAAAAGISNVQIGVTGNNVPFEVIENANAAADQKIWQNYVANDGSLNCLLLNDGANASNPWLMVTRAGYAVNQINFYGGPLVLNTPATLVLRPNPATSGASILAGGDTNMHLNPEGTGSMLLCWDSGNGVIFGNGAHVSVASVTNNGTGYFPQVTTCNGTLRFIQRTGGVITGSPNINSDGQSIILNPAAGQGVYFNWDQGGTTHFGNGAQADAAWITTAGQATFNGTVTTGASVVSGTGYVVQQLTMTGDGASGFIDGGQFFWFNQRAAQGGFEVHINGSLILSGAKNFRITHPLDDKKLLTHGCLEGPENAVYYRGEAITIDGWTEITLPDYFEALTLPEGRTVQLTQIFEDDSEAIIGTNVFSRLMASRVVDGKFKIRSSEPMAKFYWEVKAVRSDIEPLQVEKTKAELEDAIASAKAKFEKEHVEK